MARSINHPAGPTRSINVGPPFFSIASTATVYQNLGNTGISGDASGQALANAFVSPVAGGDEKPIPNPALAMLSPIIGVQLPQKTAWLRLSPPASLTQYKKAAAVSHCTRPNTDKQQNSKKRLHGISP